jgi:putative ABC transport system substrate-binding protein
MIQVKAGGLVIGSDPFFASRTAEFSELASRHKLPAIAGREFATAGGLMGYGADAQEPYRVAGLYTGRILKGEKPADLPVQQVAKIELTVNMKTAKTLGLTMPLPLLGRADEVIE